jgi:hypothetical protein
MPQGTFRNKRVPVVETTASTSQAITRYPRANIVKTPTWSASSRELIYASKQRNNRLRLGAYIAAVNDGVLRAAG